MEHRPRAAGIERDIRGGSALNAHLLLPLLASVTFVFAAMFARQAILRGARPWTCTFYANVWLGGFWFAVGCLHGETIPVAQWPGAVMVGALFVLGQLFTHLTFHFGDVSAATPIFGVKILFVAVLSAYWAGIPVPPAVWLGAMMAACGVALVQRTPGARSREPAGRRGRWAVVFALLSALSLSVFDILLQKLGSASDVRRLLPVIFTAAAICSLGMLRWTDRFPRLAALGSLRPMLAGSVLMAAQAVGMCVALAGFGDATRVNIVYALRGLWAVALPWLLAQWFDGGEQHLPRGIMVSRAFGGLLLTLAVIIAIVGNR